MQIRSALATPVRFSAAAAPAARQATPAAPRFAGEGEDKVDFSWGFKPEDDIFEQKITLPPVNSTKDESPEARERAIEWNKGWHKAYLKQEAGELAEKLGIAVDSLEMADALEKKITEENNFPQTKEYFLRYILQVRQARLPVDDPSIAKTHLALAKVLFPYSALDTTYSKLLENISDERRAEAIDQYEAGLTNSPPSEEKAEALQCVAALKFPDRPLRQLDMLEEAAQMLIKLHGYQWRYESSSHTEYADGSTFGFSSSGPSRLSDVLFRMKEILETPEGANPELLETVTQRINYASGMDYLPYVQKTIEDFRRSMAYYEDQIEKHGAERPEYKARWEEQLAEYRQNLPSWEEAVPETEAKIAAAKAHLGITDEDEAPKA